MAELSSIAEHSNFGIFLQAILWDQFVCGINNKGVQQRLLSESPLSFKKALSLTQGLKTAVQHVKELQGAAVATSQEVHKVASQLAFQTKESPTSSKAGRPQPAIDVAHQATQLISASSKMLNVTVVARKVTTGQFATASPSPLVLPTQTLWPQGRPSEASHHHCYSMA